VNSRCLESKGYAVVGVWQRFGTLVDTCLLERTRNGTVKAHLFEDVFQGPPPLATKVKVMLTVYCLILLVWIPLFTVMGSGMVFESSRHIFRAYGFVASAWAYPVLVGVSFFYRRRKPRLVWLPVVAMISILFF
jgi:hypothetical protein